VDVGSVRRVRNVDVGDEEEDSTFEVRFDDGWIFKEAIGRRKYGVSRVAIFIDSLWHSLFRFWVL